MLFLSMLLFSTSIVALVSCLIFLFKKQKKKGLIAIAICVISIFVSNFFMEINDKNNEPLYSIELKKTDTNYDSSQRMWTLTADKNGKYTLKLKANKDGKITVTSKSDPNTNFKTKVYNVKANEVVKVPLTVKTDSNNSAADFYIKADNMKTVEVFLSNPNYVEKESSSESSIETVKPSASKVKSLLKSLAGKEGIDSIKVLGFDTDVAGGSVVIVTDDSNTTIEKSTIDEIIANVCQKLNSNPQSIGTGVNIKITSPDYSNGNNVVTGYAHVDTQNLSKITEDNVQQNVSDYQNKGDWLWRKN